jgi:hypothetical protein
MKRKEPPNPKAAFAFTTVAVRVAQRSKEYEGTLFGDKVKV